MQKPFSKEEQMQNSKVEKRSPRSERMQRESNFEKILEFNKSFGIATNTTPQKDIFDTDPKLVNYRLSLIEEEVKELKDGIEAKDFVEVTDAIGDILYVVLGCAASFGLNADEVFDLVHKSNMSKLCVSEDEAKDTVKWYKINEKERYDTPAYRRSDNGTHWVVFNESTMKILKSINYKPVKFDYAL